VAPLPLLDLLICDESNPRSIAYQVALTSQHVNALSEMKALGELPEQTIASDLVRRIERCDLAPLVEIDAKGRRGELNRLLSEVIEKISALSDMITHRYLAHVQPTSTLASAYGSENWDGVEDEE
jgi:uncharacterized alpha-E superfamily protein